MLTSSLLWEIKSNQGTISYLFGTMHVRDNLAFANTNKVIDYLARCSYFKAEIDLDHAKTSISPSFYMMPDNKTLADIIPEKKLEKARAILLKSFNIDLNHYSAFHPIILINKIAEGLLSWDQHLPLDLFLWEKAKALNLQCSGIESIEEQNKTLQSLDIKEQAKALVKLAKNPKKFRTQFNRMKELYSVQDIQSLYKFTKKSLSAFKKNLLFDRNIIMSQRIKSGINQPSFYAVGAAHLAGNKGLLALLKRENLNITAIKL